MEKFNFKKKFGQNFIKDKRIVERMVSDSLIDRDTLVVEVGPGRGILTNELVKYAGNVISYEIDLTLKDYLDNKFKSTDNLEIIYEDFLNRDIIKDINKYDFSKLYFIANVPYYITTPILMKLMNLQLNVDKIVIMVQKEVGERFSAKCCEKNYSSITVYLNYFYEIKKLFLVNRNEFVPVPNVDSIVVSFSRKNDLLYVKDYDFFFKLVRDSFQFKRKNIRNNLKSYDLEKIAHVLEKNNLSLTSRAEEVSVDVFVAICNELS